MILILPYERKQHLYFADLILYSALLFQYNMGIAEATSCRIHTEEVMQMNVRERILTIRLMEKVNKKPAYAEAFGIVVVNGTADFQRQTASNSACNEK